MFNPTASFPSLFNIQLTMPAKTALSSSFRSFTHMLPLTDRLAIALQSAQKKGNIQKEKKLRSIAGRKPEPLGYAHYDYVLARDNAARAIGFTIKHGIITSSPPAQKKYGSIQLEQAKLAVYCCIMANNDDLANTLSKHFSLDEAAMQWCARNAAETELRRGRYLSAKEIAAAYGLKDLIKNIGKLQLLLTEANPLKYRSMLGSLNECDGSG